MKNKHELREEVLLRLISNPEVMKGIIEEWGLNSVDIGNVLSTISYDITQSHLFNNKNV